MRIKQLGKHQCAPRGLGMWPIVLLVIASILASCGANISSSATPISTNTTVAQDSSVVYGTPYLPTNLNPQTPGGNNEVVRQLMAQVWPSTFYQNSKFAFTVNSNLLISAELISTNPERIVYKINPRATWSDGIPITATDFIYNWKAQSGNSGILDVNGKPILTDSHVGYSDIKSVTGSNSGDTVTVVFRHYFSEWEALFSPLVPAHIAKTVGWNSGFQATGLTMVVSGAQYEVASYQANKQIRLIRNPNYWGRPATIPTLIFKYSPDPANYASDLANSSLNLVETPAHRGLVDSIKGSKNIKSFFVPSFVTQSLLFNLNNLQLSDLKVRTAIALALDRGAIAKNAIGSFGTIASAAGNNIYAPGTTQYQNDGQAYMTPQISKARSLLISAGYRFSASGEAINTSNGNPLSLTISADESNSQLALVEYEITSELIAIGVKITVHNYSLSQLAGTILPQGGYDMALFGQSTSPNASFDVDRYLSTQIGIGGNYTGFNSSTADGLIKKASGELDPATSAQTYNQLDALIWKELPSIPLFSVPNILAYNSGYKFIGQSSTKSTIFWNVDRWTFVPTH